MVSTQTTLKLQVRETFSCTIVRENAAEYTLAPGDMKGAQDFLKHAIPWLVVGAWFLIYSLVFCNSWTCMYCIAFLCSPPFLFFLGCMRPICQNMGVHFKQLVIKAKIPNILIYCYYSTYLWAGPPSTQLFENLSSRFQHLTPNQLSNTR